MDSIKQDIQYIKIVVDEIRDILRNMNERVIRIEESTAHAHERIDCVA